MDIQRNYYMVRAMDSSEKCFNVFFDNSVVATGWSEVDFTEGDRDSVIEEVKEIYYKPKNNVAPQVVGRNINEVVRFMNIKQDDYIIIPYYDSIRIAVASGESIYKATDVDLSNQHKVTYRYNGTDLVTIPRDNLSEAFQRRLRVRGMSVSDLFEFGDEIEKLFNDSNYSYVNEVVKADEKYREELKSGLLRNIRSGRTGLKTGGIGLEHLVKLLFECEGYTAKVCGKRTFSGYGDADVEAVKSDMFMEKKILAQVKHHTGDTNTWGVEQLIEIMESNDYVDYSFVFITSADVPNAVADKAENVGIAVIDGNKLVEWILTHIDRLDDSIKSALGVSSVPRLALQD